MKIVILTSYVTHIEIVLVVTPIEIVVPFIRVCL